MINWVVSSSVLILIVVGMRHFLKGKISAKLLYALWLLVAVRLLMPMSFGNSVLSIENVTNQVFSKEENVLVQGMVQESGTITSVLWVCGLSMVKNGLVSLIRALSLILRNVSRNPKQKISIIFAWEKHTRMELENRFVQKILQILQVHPLRQKAMVRLP